MNPGETREGVRVVLWRFVDDDEKWVGPWHEYFEGDKQQFNREIRTFYSEDLLTDLAEQLEARAEERGAGALQNRNVVLREAAQLIRSLTEGDT